MLARVCIYTKDKRKPTQHFIINVASARNSLSEHQHYHDMSLPGAIFDAFQCCRFLDNFCEFQ